MRIVKTRKVQETGRSSFILTLPKSWVKEQNIQKNQSLGVISRSNGTLVITKNITGNPLSRKKKIKIDPDQNLEYLYRNLIGSYLTGYHQIEISTKNRISADIRNIVMNFIRSTIGFEIYTETSNMLLLKDMIKTGEQDLIKELHRMVMLVNSMYKDAIKAIKTKDEDLIKDLNQRDEEINRIARHIIRDMAIFLQNSTQIDYQDLDFAKAEIIFTISLYLELLGDNAVIVVNNISKLLRQNPSNEIIEKIEFASEKVLSLLKSTIEAWQKENFFLANQCIDQYPEISIMCDKILEETLQPKFCVSMVKIIENIRKTAKITINIAFLTIDNLVSSNNEEI